MKKFEYKVEIISQYNSTVYKVEHEVDILNEWGKGGWELVSTSTLGQLIYGYFKRELKS